MSTTPMVVASGRVGDPFTRTLGSAPVIAFVSTVDLNRARAFYEGALGLTVEDVNDFACVLRGAGTMLRVTKVDSLTPQPFTVLGWAVEDIHAVGSALRSRGVEFLRFEGLQQDELGVWVSPGGGRIAWFQDPDGNTLSLTQF